jgi:cyanobactin maturation PatA/PatG family protease
VSPSQQELTSQQQAGFQPTAAAPAYQGGIPGHAPLGAQPNLTPAQRSAAMIGGFSGLAPGRQLVQSGRGVAPSQTIATCPLPNDFISAENSQLVYAIGTLGYDFITDARRDYFVQQLTDMSGHDDYVNLFKQSLGMQPNVVYYPEDHRAMAAYLYQNGPNDTPVLNAGAFGFHAEDTGSLVWVLYQENMPQYALRPIQTLAYPVLVFLATFLYYQSFPANLLDENGIPQKDDEGNPIANPNKADRASIAGRIIGDMMLYNGQRVPVLDVSLRALAQWNIRLLIEDIAGQHPEVRNTSGPLYQALDDFLQRIYYEVRNLGQAPSDRAINYMATNIFEAGNVFADAIANGLALDSIYAEKSPLCRPKSDCWDVVMRFFNPKDRLGTALTEYRLTVDVNDISPVAIGTRRKWARFA